MFFRNLKPKHGTVLNVVLVDVHLPLKLGHRDANKLFAEPMKARLAAAGLGTVLDCKLRTRGSGQVIGVDLFLGLTDASQSAFATIATMLEALAAPCGSSIRHSDCGGDPHLFGRAEGLEVSVAADVTPNAQARRELALTCREAIETLGVSRGWNEADGCTRLYFYGEDLSEMKARLAHKLEDHPLFAAASLRRMA